MAKGYRKGAERKIHKAAGSRAKHGGGVYVPRYIVKIQKSHPCAGVRWGVYDGDVLVEGGLFMGTAMDYARILNKEYERTLEDYAGTLNR